MNNKYLLSLILLIIGMVIFALAVGFKYKQLSHSEFTRLAESERVSEFDSQQVSVSAKATADKQDDNNYMNKVIIGGQEIKVELADTGSKRAQGLSGRDPLPAGTGMLFIFDRPAVYPFWMNKIKFAIDIIWINEGKIVDIWANAPIPDESGPQTYKPKGKALYVLEVNAGFVAINDLKIGDMVSLKLD